MLCTTLALAIGLHTIHIPTDKEFNNDNNLVGVGCDKVSYAHFTNSYYGKSHLVGYNFELVDKGIYSAGIIPSLISGYDAGPYDPIIFAPIVYGQVRPLRLNVMYNAIHLSLHYEIEL